MEEAGGGTRLWSGEDRQRGEGPGRRRRRRAGGGIEPGGAAASGRARAGGEAHCSGRGIVGDGGGQQPPAVAVLRPGAEAAGQAGRVAELRDQGGPAARREGLGCGAAAEGGGATA